jgi:hypothetical protein
VADGIDDIDACAIRMHAIFRGREDAYIQTVLTGDVSASGKAEARTYCVRKLLDVNTWRDHLLGNAGIGVYPMQPNNTVYFGAIDVDQYTGDTPVVYVQRLHSGISLPLIVTRSKSGGAHIWLFLKQPAPASRVRKFLGTIRDALGLSPKTEIFPAQDTIKVDSGDLGNAINCPYFDHSKGNRYMIDLDGKSRGISTFLQMVETAQAKYPGLADYESAAPVVSPPSGDDPLLGAPPCLKFLLSSPVTEGGRAQVLYQFAVYAKKRFGSDTTVWEDAVRAMHASKFTPGLSDIEVNKTIKSVAKNDAYNYRCMTEPMASVCNRGQCVTMEWGVKAVVAIDAVTQMRAPDGDSIWFMSINGIRSVMDTKTFINQMSFRVKCVEALRQLPDLMKRADYDNYIREAMKRATLVEMPEDATEEASVKDLLISYIRDRATEHIVNLEKYARPYINTTAGKIVFVFSDLRRYMAGHDSYRSLRISPLVFQKSLSDIGVTEDHKTYARRVRCISIDLLPDLRSMIRGAEITADQEQAELPMGTAPGVGVPGEPEEDENIASPL